MLPALACDIVYVLVKCLITKHVITSTKCYREISVLPHGQAVAVHSMENLDLDKACTLGQRILSACQNRHRYTIVFTCAPATLPIQLNVLILIACVNGD